MTPPALAVNGLTKHFALHRNFFSKGASTVHAVDEVSFAVPQGSTLALVGESGCGKSTVARCVVGLTAPTSGRISLRGEDVTSPAMMRRHRREIQLISQNPGSALNRRMTIRHSMMQPLLTHRVGRSHQERESKVRNLLERVGLGAEYLDRHPASISGGQLQRVVIARSLGVEPTVLILDEPTSSLDVSVKAKLMNLFLELQREMSLTYVLITHEIGLARHIADHIAIMYLGKIVEIGPTEEIMNRPRHPYTKLLLASLPVADPRDRRPFAIIEGEVPSAISPPSGCRFHTRCPIAVDRCRIEEPPLRNFGVDHEVACHLADQAVAETLITSVGGV
jgi:oligopeptide/dipeptide ABC transporter ATP-binding protein